MIVFKSADKMVLSELLEHTNKHIVVHIKKRSVLLKYLSIFKSVNEVVLWESQGHPYCGLYTNKEGSIEIFITMSKCIIRMAGTHKHIYRGSKTNKKGSIEVFMSIFKYADEAMLPKWLEHTNTHIESHIQIRRVQSKYLCQFSCHQIKQ